MNITCFGRNAAAATVRVAARRRSPGESLFDNESLTLNIVTVSFNAMACANFHA
jgi:hypothetical protein